MGGYFGGNSGGGSGGGGGGTGTVTQAFVKSWGINDWILNGSVYEYTIPASEHGKTGVIDAETYIADGANWDEVQVSTQIDTNNNDVVITCGDAQDRYVSQVKIYGSN